MSAFCGNPDCPSNWADLPCTCPQETPLVELPEDESSSALSYPDAPSSFLREFPKPRTQFDIVMGLDRMLTEVLATSDRPELTPEQELLVALTEIVTEAQHGPDCYISPDDTICNCLIGKVKTVLPMCTERRNAYGGPDEVQRMGEEPQPYWRCVLIEHPDNPDRHEFREA